MKRITTMLIIGTCILLLLGSFVRKEKPRVLVFAETKGFYHQSIPVGMVAMQQLGKENGFEVDTTRESVFFNDKQLKKYAAVVFLNTTGDVLNNEEQEAFQQYIRAGGGFAGIHAATDTEYDWPWFNRLVGAYFKSHPKQQNAVLTVTDTTHPSTMHLSAQWKRWDEWYNFKDIQPSLHVLLTIDEKSYAGGENGDHHPMSWYHEFDGGRAFYTALGHTNESYADPLFLQHVLGGIRYVMKKSGKVN